MRTRALGVPYALARVPLTVVDRSVMQRLPPGTLLRTVFDHGLGVADHWAGLILANHAIVDSGRARIEHAGRFTGHGDQIRPRVLAPSKLYARTRHTT